NLILYNGRLFTQDPHFPQATAIAIRDSHFLAVGDDADIRALAKPHTRLIDLGGRRVLPGLTDAHFHFYDWALARRGVDLTDVTSLTEARERVCQAIQAASPGQWILGQGWNQDTWPDPRLPHRADLDDMAPDNPVILWRTDLHLVWANSRALQAAGITANTPEPKSGIIERDESGQPTGILRELAINLVRRVIPPPTAQETDEAMRQAMAAVHQVGLTGVHDMRIMGGEEGPPAFHAWQRLRTDGGLRLRVWMMLPGERLDEAIALGLRTGLGDDYLRVGGIKLFADGATGPRTAWMLAPFEDSGTGLPLRPMAEIADIVSRAHQAGISVAVHAIGDRAVRELLDVFTEAFPRLIQRARPLAPPRIEHVQHSHPDDLKRLAPLGLVASVQPLHITDDMLMIERACGKRARWAYAFRDLLDAGTVLALGSDCPVASPNPFWGIHAAVTRQRRDGTPAAGWYPNQRLGVAEAVRGYTLGPAYASGQMARQGSLTPGKLADLIVLDRDIFAVPPEEIADTEVVLTIFDGRIVYRSEGFGE
ncbi:MAG TPA: amidohydrolase, partial [Anaerolineae bacterium]|nr:amidohydrolase [Anaerolineae bacterium]